MPDDAPTSPVRDKSITGPLSVGDCARRLRSGDISSEELTRHCISRADELDDRLGVFVTRFDEQALEAARHADSERARGIDRGVLHGVPIGIKDILAVAEGPTTAQSLVLDPKWGAGRDAPVVTRLRAAGAVVVGKLTTMEFAMGRPDTLKPFPVPRNPWDESRWAGGSSSGAGNGVAADMFPAAIGTDTGGSIRIPAAFCGITGIKPTFGRVPKSGCVPLAYSLDHIGPLARSAADCAEVLRIIAGSDPSDPHSIERPVPDYPAALDGRLDGVRIGVEREHHPTSDTTVELEDRMDAALEIFRDLGATVSDISIPNYDEAVTAQMITLASEALAYHRNDLRTRGADYFAGTVEYTSLGALVSGADYVQAQRVRRFAQAKVGEVLRTVDVIVTPTSSVAAPRLDELDEKFSHIFGNIFTRYWNAVGNPTLVMPIGFTLSGMPLSIQLAGRPFEEATLLRAGDAYQRVTNWHVRTPATPLQ